MKQQTTQRIFKDQLPWIRKCCKALKMSFAEFIEEFERQTKMKKQNDFFLRLPIPSNYLRPLENVRINKIRNYKVCIQKGSVT